MIQFIALRPGVEPDHVGMIPMFLDVFDERKAAEQLDSNYQHGGGWRPQKGFTLDKRTGALTYGDPGAEDADPPIYPLASSFLRDELILIYPYGYVLIMQKDRTWEVCRMD